MASTRHFARTSRSAPGLSFVSQDPEEQNVDPHKKKEERDLDEEIEPDYMANLDLFIPGAAEALGKEEQGHEELKPKPQGKMHWKHKRQVKEEQRKQSEDEVLKEGLGTSIPASNIGFKMLAKMGYQAGAPIGRDGQGRIEPVNIDLKRNKAGLGRDEILREQKKRKQEEFEKQMKKSQRKEDELRAGYKEQRRGQWEVRKIARDIDRAKATLLQLEEKEGHNTMPGDGSVDEGGDKAEGEEEEEEPTLEYGSQEELQTECPGQDEDSH
eukprot:jgi/Mesen1/8975/ME000056S08382